jgi:hypothetical protein
LCQAMFFEGYVPRWSSDTGFGPSSVILKIYQSHIRVYPFERPTGADDAAGRRL